MLRSLIDYFLALLNCPESRHLGFLDMGMGILWRSRRLRAYWQEHLDQCLALERVWLQDRNFSKQEPSKLAVLGAGYLLDLDLALMAEHFSNIVLIDANPLSQRSWEKAQKKFDGICNIEFCILEITGLLQRWQCSLRQALKSLSGSKDKWNSALRLIEELSQSCSADHKVYEFACGHSSNLKSNHSPPVWCSRKFDAVISLNLLSQIPVMWQACVERLLTEHFSACWVRTHEAEWLRAYAANAQVLLKKHFADIAASNAEYVLLLTDVEYAHYNWIRPLNTRRVEAPPFIWRFSSSKAEAEWQLNPELEVEARKSKQTLRCEVSSALYGINLEDKRQLEALLPAYTQSSYKSWSWHIQPYGSEQGDLQGQINRVAGLMFCKKCG